MLKVAQVAERLNCSVTTVYQLIQSGKLAHHRCPGIRVSEEQLCAYLEKTRREGEPAAPRKTPDSHHRLKHITV
jgi:excisionase family DNA binding protein